MSLTSFRLIKVLGRPMLAFLVTLFVLQYTSLQAQTFNSGFSAAPFGSGWVLPMGVAFNKTGTKLFVWEKGGKVYLYNWNSTTSAYVKQSTPVINLSEEVGNWGDHGLCGFALHPNYETNGLIYLQYVVDRHHLLYFGTASYSPTANLYSNATIQRVTRYKTTFNSGNEVVADPASRFILIGESKTTGIPVTHDSHSGGALAFGRDTTLLISTGDGASYSNFLDTGNNPTSYWQQALADGIIRSNENRGAYRSQMVNCHNGKILRIDPMTGDGIPGNPFYLSASPRAPQSRVWAMGFRNPFRFSIKPNSGSTDRTAANPGDLYVGDVGNSNWEELNIINAPGQNCGWPLFEGIVTTIDPAYDYYGAIKSLNNYDELNPLYGTGGCTQRYFTFQNLLKQATADNNTTVYNPCNSTTPITGTIGARYFHRVAAIDWFHWNNTARVKYFSGNTLSAVQIGTTSSGVTGSPFMGNCSSGGCWYTGSMFPSSYKNTFFLADYGANWIKNLSMDATVTDKVRNVTSFASGYAGIIQIVENPLDGSLFTVDVINQNILRIIYGNGNLLPTAKAGADKTYGPSALTVNFNSTGSKDPEGGALTYSWNFGDGTALSTSANPSHSFTATGPKKFVVYLTVKDNQNAVSTDSIIISVNNTPPSVNITSPVKNSYYNIGPDTVYTLSASVSDAEHSSGQLSYKWQAFLHHNLHEHPEPIDTNKTSSITLTRPDNTATDTFYWIVYLTVTDAAGLSTIDSSRISPISSYKVPPNITVHPQSQTICEGKPVTFSSSVNNSPLPSVQWQESSNGTTWTNISGATTSSYTFNTLLTDNGKKYRAVWTNSGGSATSNAATLTVNATPAAPTGQAIQSFSVSATVANLQATGSSIKWYAASTGGTPLLSTTALSSGTHYFASQTVSTCESAQRLDVTAYIVTTPLSASATAAAVNCAGQSNGSVTATASGGISPYQYSINGGTTYQTGNSFSNLTAGSYTITVKDYVNATTQASATVTQPTAVSFTAQKTDISCTTATGSISVSASGGSPGYTYSKDNGTSFQATNQFNSLSSGTYALVVKDANGCLAPAQSVSIANSSTATATLNASGSAGSISSYAWTLVSGPSTPAISNANTANASANQLVSGLYVFQLALNGGASTSRVNVNVNAPASPLTAHAGYDRVVNLPVDTVVLDANGSTGSINGYDWALISSHTVNPTFNATEAAPVVRGLQEGIYRFGLGVKDGSNNIVARDTVQVTVNAQPVTAPVIAAVNSKASNTNTVTNSLSAVPAKALLVLTLAQGDDFTTAPHASVSSTPALTWTKRADADAPGSGNAEIYTAVFNAGGKITITSIWGTKPISASAYVITGYDTLLGNNLSLYRDSQTVVSIPVNTSLRNSLIIAVSADKKGISGTGRTYLDATETQYHTKSGVYTGYHYRKQTTAKGLYNQGITKPTGLMAGTAVLEIRGIINNTAPLNAHAGYNQNISCPAPLTGQSRQITPEVGLEASGPVVKVYPNPGNGWFHLSIEQASGGSGYLKVFDARGVVVVQRKIYLMQGKNQFDIPLHDKPNGIYYFQLQHSGRSIISKALKN